MHARTVAPGIQVADQPDLADFQRIASEGFRGVVNLRMDREPEQPLTPESEGEQVRALGLDYLHRPVGGAPLTGALVSDVTNFITERTRDGGQILVHCRKGGRAVALVLLALAQQGQWNRDEVISRGADLGLLVDGSLRTMVEDYLQREGTA